MRFGAEAQRVPLCNGTALDQARTGMTALMNARNDDQGQNERDDPSENEKYELAHRSSYSFNSHCKMTQNWCSLRSPESVPRRAANKVL
jgi:hypothetical protein